MNGFDLSTISDLYVGGTQASAIYYGSNLIWPTGPHDYSQDYFTIECVGNSGTLRWKSSSGSFTRDISYSTDKVNWTTITSSNASNGTVIANLTKGDKVYLKGANTEYATGMSNHTRIWSNVKFNVYGNLMSLLYGDNFKTSGYNYTSSYVFEQLFSEAPVEDASNLIFPTCTSNYCYDYMFNYCTSLLYPPKILEANYGIQYNCYCYRYMFRNCNKMTTSPYLPNVFVRGNTGNYNNMFNSCSSLNSVTCLSEYGHTNEFNGWMTGVSATGTFTKKSGTTWSTGANGIPSGWTVVEV